MPTFGVEMKCEHLIATPLKSAIHPLVSGEDLSHHNTARIAHNAMELYPVVISRLQNALHVPLLDTF